MNAIIDKFKEIAADFKRIQTERDAPFVQSTCIWLKERAIWQFDRFEHRVYPIKVIHYFARRYRGEIRKNRYHRKALLLGRFSKNRCIPHLLFHVCAICQNRCVHCSHTGLIEKDPTYQMSMETLHRFLTLTKSSRYFIENLWIDGPGEPTLWTHFNKGIDALFNSNVIGAIHLTTNGQSLHFVNDATWSKLSRVTVSLYPEHSPSLLDTIEHLQKRHGFFLEIRNKTMFRERPTAVHPDTLPGYCICAGPMIYGDRIVYHCGPNGVDAARLKGDNLFKDPSQCGPLAPHYLDGITTTDLHGSRPYRKTHFDICRYCWANWRIKLKNMPHQNRPKR